MITSVDNVKMMGGKKKKKQMKGNRMAERQKKLCGRVKRIGLGR